MAEAKILMSIFITHTRNGWDSSASIEILYALMSNEWEVSADVLLDWAVLKVETVKLKWHRPNDSLQWGSLH